MKFIHPILLALVIAAPFPALAVSSMEERIDKTIDVLEEYGKAQGDSIPRKVFHDAKGLAVLWLIKVGSYRDWETDRKSTRLNSSHSRASRMPSSA